MKKKPLLGGLAQESSTKQTTKTKDPWRWPIVLVRPKIKAKQTKKKKQTCKTWVTMEITHGLDGSPWSLTSNFKALSFIKGPAVAMTGSKRFRIFLVLKACSRGNSTVSTWLTCRHRHVANGSKTPTVPWMAALTFNKGPLLVFTRP